MRARWRRSSSRVLALAEPSILCVILGFCC
jgi:hypothetical protein